MTAPLVIILAGGEGRRIGGGKPLRRLNGERLIDRAVRAGHQWSNDVRIAVRDPKQIAELPSPFVLDDLSLSGPLAGLAAGLGAARSAGRTFLLTLPCDVPFLPSDLADRLHDAVGAGLAAIAGTKSRLHPTCALWRVEALDRLPAYVASGRRSLIGFAEASGYGVARWRDDPFLNVNTEADMAEAERRCASEVEHVDLSADRDAGRPGP